MSCSYLFNVCYYGGVFCHALNQNLYNDIVIYIYIYYFKSQFLLYGFLFIFILTFEMALVEIFVQSFCLASESFQYVLTNVHVVKDSFAFISQCLFTKSVSSFIIAYVCYT